MASNGPMDEGSTQGQIQTPMCESNVGGGSDNPPTHKYKDMPSSSGGGSGSGSDSIMGPGDVYQKGK